MKKTILLFLALFYSVASSGMAIKLHDCIDTTFFCDMPHQEQSSDHCTESKVPDCCKTTVKWIKSDVAQKADLLQITHLSVPAFLPPAVFNFEPIDQEFSSAIAQHYPNAPPVNGNSPIFILHQNFRL